MSTRTAPPDLRAVPRDAWASTLTAHYRTGLTGLLDVEVLHVEPGRIDGRLPLRDELMMGAGDLLHAGTIVAFGDSFAGWGCLATLPDGVAGFATGELKVNLVATTGAHDSLTCVARMLHGGRTTQVWDVTIARESDGRVIAHFRCTQHLLSGGAATA
jgi:1,4-dihydroxy-2-naphthoyl-CoA hydrolase